MLARVYPLIRIDRYLSMKQARTICVGIKRVKWSDNVIYISYLGQVYTYPNHRLCTIFGLGSVWRVEKSYLV